MTSSLTERLVAKLAGNETPYGIAAVLVGETSAADLDGAEWALQVSDGRQVADLRARLSGSQWGRPGMAIDEAKLVAAIERRARNCPVESRLAEFVAASPIVLTAEDV